MPAVANAVFDAVGVRVDEIPVSPEAVLRALAEKAKVGPRGWDQRVFQVSRGPKRWWCCLMEGGDGRAVNQKKRTSTTAAEAESHAPTPHAPRPVCMMRAPKFRYVRTRTIQDAVAALVLDERAMLIAGGTDLVPT